MKFLKHILVVVALLLAAVPSMHADAQHGHGHEHDADAELCALPAHSCHCHSCEPVPCNDRSQTPQEMAAPAYAVAPSPASIALFTLSEYTPALKQVPPSAVAGILASIQTVRLLI